MLVRRGRYVYLAIPVRVIEPLNPLWLNLARHEIGGRREQHSNDLRRRAATLIVDGDLLLRRLGREPRRVRASAIQCGARRREVWLCERPLALLLIVFPLLALAHFTLADN